MLHKNKSNIKNYRLINMNVLILPMGVAMLRNMSELQTQTPGGEDAANYRHIATNSVIIA